MAESNALFMDQEEDDDVRPSTTVMENDDEGSSDNAAEDESSSQKKNSKSSEGKEDKEERRRRKEEKKKRKEEKKRQKEERRAAKKQKKSNAADEEESEADGDGASMSEGEPKKKQKEKKKDKKSKKSKSRFIEGEAEVGSDDDENESGDEAGADIAERAAAAKKKRKRSEQSKDNKDDDDEDDDSEDLDEFEKDDFIVDEETSDVSDRGEGEEGANDEEARARRRRRKQKSSSESAKIRLKKKRERQLAEELRELQDNGTDEEAEVHAARQEAIEAAGGEAAAAAEARKARRAAAGGGRAADEEEEDQDDMRNFIVGQPYEDEEDAEMEEMRREAEEIFGSGFELDAFVQQGEDYEDEAAVDEAEAGDRSPAGSDTEMEQPVEGGATAEGAEGAESAKAQRRRELRNTAQAQRRAKLESTFTPDELARMYMTASDQTIRVTDVPERLQIERLKAAKAAKHHPRSFVPPPTEEEITQEAEWMYQCISENHQRSGTDAPDELKYMESCKQALKFMLVENLEVPFIDAYRREYVENLKTEDLWEIYRLDCQYTTLYSKKKQLMELYEKLDVDFKEACAHNDAMATDMIPSFDLYQSMAADCKTQEEITDMYLHVHLQQSIVEHFKGSHSSPDAMSPDAPPGAAASSSAAQSKRPTRRDKYTLCRREGLSAFVSEFGLYPHQYAENLQRGHVVHDTRDNAQEPLAAATPFVTALYSTPELVLNNVRHMIAYEIAREPATRKKIRSAYETKATITIVMTPKGELCLDDIPEYTDIKSKTKIPIRTFFTNVDRSSGVPLHMETLMKAFKAEKEGYVKIIFDPLSKETIEDELLIQDLRIEDLYLSQSFTSIAKAWNNQRSEMFREVMQILQPQMHRYLRNLLAQHVRDHVARICSDKLREYVMSGPFVPPPPTQLEGFVLNADEREEDEEDNDALPGRFRVLGCMNEGNGMPTTFVILDENGELIDFLAWSHGRSKGRSADGIQLIAEQMRELRDFIVRHRPRGLVVGTSGMDSRLLYDELLTLRTSMINGQEMPPADREEDPQAVQDWIRMCRRAASRLHVAWADDDIASIYSKSKRGQLEFPDHPSSVRYCISLARRFQDPIAEIAQLADSSTTSPDGVVTSELTFMRLYQPWQDLIDQDLLLTRLTQTMVDCVCRVGVEVNRAVARTHSQGLLSFVAGLGPRKAAHLVRQIKALKKKQVTNRTELLSITGKTVFANCAGFLKVTRHMQGDRWEVDSPLDGTRVHPESYEYTTTMAVSALYGYMPDDEKKALAIRDIMASPHMLDELELDTYAAQLQRNKGVRKQYTLENIRRELQQPRRDLRRPYCDLSPEVVFYLLLAETPQSLGIESEVLVRVTRIQRPPPVMRGYDQPAFDQGDRNSTVLGRLDNGLMCSCSAIEFDSHEYMAQEGITGGARLPARIKSIDYDKFTVKVEFISKAERDARAANAALLSKRRSQQSAAIAAHARRLKQQQQQMSRVIDHPLFHNFTYKQAETYLENREPGEMVIRPSSKYTDRICVTIKFYGDLYLNIEIKEENKPTPISLGRTLVIAEEKFEDLDEVIFRHVDKVMEHSREMVNFGSDKFSESTAEEIEAKLRQQKAENPSRTPYMITLHAKRPGRFVLMYLPGKTIRSEDIYVKPEGFILRSLPRKVFASPSRLINGFKEMIMHQQKAASQSMMSAGAGGAASAVSRPPSTYQPSATPQYGGRTPSYLGVGHTVGTPGASSVHFSAGWAGPSVPQAAASYSSYMPQTAAYNFPPTAPTAPVPAPAAPSSYGNWGAASVAVPPPPPPPQQQPQQQQYGNWGAASVAVPPPPPPQQSNYAGGWGAVAPSASAAAPQAPQAQQQQQPQVYGGWNQASVPSQQQQQQQQPQNSSYGRWGSS